MVLYIKQSAAPYPLVQMNNVDIYRAASAKEKQRLIMQYSHYLMAMDMKIDMDLPLRQISYFQNIIEI